MNSNNQNIQNYYDLPMDQTGNSSAPQQIFNNKNESIQHTLINNVGISDLNTLHINSTTPAPYNTTYEFYFHLPNDTRIYRVTYSELNLSENVQLLNNGINHIPGYLLPHHYNVQSLIQKQIQQQVQHPIYQQNDIQQQSFDTTQSTFQVYSNNDTYNTASISVNGTVSYDMQDTRFQDSS
ncbi:hypothetical protein RhiirA5_427682 [Rhizophagus irregularis]|uniref:Uncharacterized protein n=1 Tax=Rhizophagus irregularis TaxID=588596 RepID=A0A2I1F137_9GLOM|nr:hypothetical protein RhiirA5_427682 [Rhizophagus irregularis]PKC69484.1 hypothetical protein RhiirA1_504453 [Rhizophagus irregularis]PKY28074.1 hypothetical protein RhiirB3_390778 [Rhizophagus irregularis]CAB4478438.1 unnamed protein product [Rhizophagus irregularis]CAB5357505.1 unnamed protein product [Rhizophagus irregularis]